MKGAIGILRGAVALLALGVLFCGLDLYQRFVLGPRVRRNPATRSAQVDPYMRWVARTVLDLARLGGARFDLRGQVPTGAPALVIMNHQSLLDIPVATAMAGPRALRFVTRWVYARGVPLVSGLLRLSDGVIVNADHAARAAVRTLVRAADTLESGLLIFPEGVRTRDGSLASFRRAGLRALLKARRLPVYLLVIDGAWQCRTILDVAFRLHRIRARTAVLGPFEAPAAPGDLPGFISELEERMRAALLELRGETARG